MKLINNITNYKICTELLYLMSHLTKALSRVGHPTKHNRFTRPFSYVGSIPSEKNFVFLHRCQDRIKSTQLCG